MNSLRFLFEGQRITDNHTPKEVSFFLEKALRSSLEKLPCSARPLTRMKAFL